MIIASTPANLRNQRSSSIRHSWNHFDLDWKHQRGVGRERKISLFRKIIHGSGERDPVEKHHWYENEYRLWLSTDSHLCQCVPFNLSAWCNGLQRSSASEGFRIAVEEEKMRGREEGEEKEEKMYAESRASSTWNALHDHRVRKAQINYIMARLKRMLFNHRPEPP